MHKSLFVLPVLAVAALASAARAATPTLYSDTSNLLPNTPNQIVKIYVAGTDQIAGEDLNIQINGAASGPTFTSGTGVDILTGTIFAANHQAPTGPGIVTSGTASGRFAVYSLTTASGTVADSGLLLTLSIDTGPSSGSVFSLAFSNTLNGSSSFISAGTSPSAIGLSYVHNLFSIGTADRQWTVNGGGTWDTDSHWTPFAPYAVGDVANFYGAATSGTATVTLDGQRVAGVVNFNNAAASYVLTAGAGGSLVLNNGTSAPSVNVAAGEHTISAPVTLTANTNLSAAAGSTLTLSGAISGGSSSLAFTGPGKLILAGNNTYGTMTIVSGTVQVGNGTTAGKLGSGAVSNSGTLAFNRPDAVVINNTISGTGGISQLGTGTTTLSSYQGTGNVSVAAGTLAFAPTNAVRQTSGVAIQIANLSMGSSSVLDMTNHDLLIGNTTYAAVQDQILAAFGAVVGPAITTSTSNVLGSGVENTLPIPIDATAFSLTEWDGVTLTQPNTVIVKYTIFGDATLDGSVNGDDFSVIAGNFGMSTPGAADIVTAWLMGDVTLDGVVNGDDFSVIAGNFGQGPMGGLEVAGEVKAAMGATAPVPEPGSLALLGTAIVGLVSYRRHKQRRRATS